MKKYTTHLEADLRVDKSVLTIRFYFEDCDEDYVAILYGPLESIQSALESRSATSSRVETLDIVEPFVNMSGDMRVLESYRLELENEGGGSVRISFSGDVYFPGLKRLSDFNAGFEDTAKLGDVCIDADSFEEAQAIWFTFINSFGDEEACRELKPRRHGGFRAQVKTKEV